MVSRLIMSNVMQGRPCIFLDTSVSRIVFGHINLMHKTTLISRCLVAANTARYLLML
jgi:hypothetical protein